MASFSSTFLPDGPRGQAMALGIAALGAALLWPGLAAPAFDWYADRAETLQREQATAARMAAQVRTLPELRGRAAELAGQAHRDALLEGATDGVAAAALQEMLEHMAAASGTRIASAEPLPAERAAGDLRAISVRITVNAPFKAVVGLLAAIADADTPMLVDNLQLRASPMPLGAEAERQMEASFSVTAWRAGETAP
jgi:type II secretory pathway component PulM